MISRVYITTSTRQFAEVRMLTCCKNAEISNSYGFSERMRIQQHAHVELPYLANHSS